MLSSLLPRLLNHLLTQADWARARLRAHTAKQARFEIGSLHLNLVVTDSGHLANAEEGEATPDVVLTLPPDLAARLLQGQEALTGGIRIAGDAEFADALGFVLRHLRWNVEDDLSRVIGDIPAHRVVGTTRELAAGLPRVLGSAARSLATYLSDEKPTVVATPQLAQLADESAALRDQLARCEKRIQRLEEKRRNTPS